MRIAGSADQQLKSAACRPRTKKSSEDSASGDYGAQQFSLEIFRDQIGHGHWSPAQDAVHVPLAEVAEGAASFEHAPKIAAAGVVDIGRCGGERFRDHFADFAERLFELGILRGVFL